MSGNVYYFGCYRESGHYLWTSPPMAREWDLVTPWGIWMDLDGTFPPAHGSLPGPEIEPQGPARLHRRDGWTAIGWWDRSVDHRGACNSALLVDSDVSFSDVLLLGADAFPLVMERLPFLVYQAEVKP